MEEPFDLLPQTERLLRKLEALEEPLIQVWGWPGSGKAVLLRCLLEWQGPRARGLSLGDFAREDELRETLQSAHAAGVRWLVASGRSAEGLAAVARWLVP